MVVVRLVYIIILMVCVAVGAVHRSRIVSQRGAVGIREGDVTTVYCYVGWGRDSFCWYVFVCNRRILV
jgi:hypothetical protein